MFAKDKREKFSLRKYKDGRTDSKLIGATILATGVALAIGASPVAANVTSNGQNYATPVTDTSKVSSSAATIFTDNDNNSKIVKVDAVLGSNVTEPTKANVNTGEADGNDTLNAKSEATVNYKLNSDKSLLKSGTVEAGATTITTPYDKKGLAYDVDGKDYRESTVTKTGDTVSETTGKKDTVEANGKVYEYAGKSEVEGADKLTYEKTHFNNIEAPVSPEGMHNKLGEIDYTKTKGKVYLVEETADGKYGKYVVADGGVSSDEDAATKWKNGQADAKEFTKENVTLQEGDSILVLDKDTYAVGKSKQKNVIKTGNQTYELVRPVEVEDSRRGRDYNTYTIDEYTYENNALSVYRKPGADGIFGTADDVVKTAQSDPTYALYGFSGTYDNPLVSNAETNEEYSSVAIDAAHSTLHDVVHNFALAHYKALEFLASKANTDSDRAKVQEAKTRLDNHLKTFEDDVKSGKIDVGILDSGRNKGRLVLHTSADYNTNVNDVNAFEDALGGRLARLLDGLTITSTEDKSTRTYGDYPVYKKIVVKTKYSFSSYGPHANIEYTKTTSTTSYDIWKEDLDVNSVGLYNEREEEVPSDNLATNGVVSISENGTIRVQGQSDIISDIIHSPLSRVPIGDGYYVTGTNAEREQISAKTITDYTKKEIITPIRAYKVMGEAKPVVTHYYNLKITKEQEGEATASKQGSVVIKYVTTDGKQLKSETDKDNVTLETKTIVSLYSGETKVDEREDKATVEQNYDTTPKQYPTLVDADTGFTYKYVGLKQGSPAASGKVVEGTTEVVYEYRLVSEEEKTPSKSEVTKTGSVDVKHVVINEDGSLKTLKETEVVKNNVPLEYEDTYVTYSKGVKISERKETRAATKETYDTTDKQYPTLKDEATGLVYKYVGQTSDSAPATGDVAEGEKHVIYSYTLDKQEEATPSKVVETKGSVVVKYVDADGNEIKDTENVVTDAVVKTTKTYATKSGDVILSTRDEVEEHTVAYDTQAAKKQTIIKDGKKYNFYRVLPVDTKFNNVTEETGNVKEGVTTIVYQYDYIIPVDPTKPNEGEQTPPKPGDKIPNDPQNRTYEQAGLVKNVTRTIDYQYASGPKKGEKASESVVQTARFTRKAEMNARTGELAYEPWSNAQTLEKVVSPVIDTYVVDKESVEALEVNSESKDTKKLVQYTLNVRVIEHDADKDKKGSVILKFVDSNENPIAADVVLKDKITIALAKTVITGDKEETTYTPTNETYAAKAEEIIEVDGVQFKLKRVLPVSDKFKNTVEESGLVKEGVTTIVYQYTMQMSTPVVDIPEFTGGVIPLDPPIVEIPEFNGGINPIDPPVVEIPEYNGDIVPIEPPIYDIPRGNDKIEPIKPPVTVIPTVVGEKPPVQKEIPKETNKDVVKTEKFVSKELPNTGTTHNTALTLAGISFGMFGIAILKKKKD